jgi:hypothetical protein
MAAPVLQSGEVRVDLNGSPFDVAKPAGVVAGDLLLVLIFHANVVTWNTPAGWTAGSRQTTRNPFIAPFWRVADGSEGASFTFTTTGSATSADLICHRITGADPAAPVDAVSVASVAFNGANPISLPSVTTLGPDRLLLAVFAAASTVTTFSFSTPTGMTAGYVYSARPSPNTQESAFTQSVANAGATGSRDSNINSTSSNRTAILLAIASPLVAVAPPRMLSAMQAVQRASVI